MQLKPAAEKNIVMKSKEAMARLSEIRRPMKRFKDLRIGSWNVLSLYLSKSLQMLLDQLEKYHVDITCVQEMRWIGSGTTEKKHWIIFYNCDNKEHKLGTEFVIHKKVKHLIMNFQPKSPRMCWLKIRGKIFKLRYN
jgi:exonuclease III